MRCLTQKKLKIQTTKGVMEVEPGRVITLADEEEVIRLINERKIAPLDRHPWRFYSEILKDHLWVVHALEDAGDLIAQGEEEPIYTAEEIQWLYGACRETVKMVHEAKKVFQDSKIQEVNKKARKGEV